MKLIVKTITLVLLILACCDCFSQEGNLNMSQYQLGSGDKISITVFGQEELSMELTLPDVGTINYPFLGEIKIVGKTTAQVEALIYDGLKGDYLVEPSVSVTFLEYRPFFIDGEVKRPGGYPYQPGLSINKAVALAGGYTNRASKNTVLVVREFDGEPEELSLKVSDMIQPGDIITIEQRFF